MWVEALAAGLVGLALLTLVLSPLVAGQLPEAPLQDEPDELDETPRGAALLALKEIEFDQATGKLSDEDYAVLKSKYTVVALAALRDGEERTEKKEEDKQHGVRSEAPIVTRSADVETLIARRLEALGTGEVPSASCPICGPRPEVDARYCSGCGRALEESGREILT